MMEQLNNDKNEMKYETKMKHEIMNVIVEVNQ